MPIKTKKSKKMTHKHKITLKNNIEKSLLLNLNLNERTLVCGTTSNEYNSFESTFVKNPLFCLVFLHTLLKMIILE